MSSTITATPGPSATPTPTPQPTPGPGAQPPAESSADSVSISDDDEPSGNHYTGSVVNLIKSQLPSEFTQQIQQMEQDNKAVDGDTAFSRQLAHDDTDTQTGLTGRSGILTPAGAAKAQSQFNTKKQADLNALTTKTRQDNGKETADSTSLTRYMQSNGKQVTAGLDKLPFDQRVKVMTELNNELDHSPQGQQWLAQQAGHPGAGTYGQLIADTLRPQQSELPTGSGVRMVDLSTPGFTGQQPQLDFLGSLSSARVQSGSKAFSNLYDGSMADYLNANDPPGGEVYTAKDVTNGLARSVQTAVQQSGGSSDNANKASLARGGIRSILAVGNAIDDEFAPGETSKAWAGARMVLRTVALGFTASAITDPVSFVNNGSNATDFLRVQDKVAGGEGSAVGGEVADEAAHGALAPGVLSRLQGLLDKAGPALNVAGMGLDVFNAASAASQGNYGASASDTAEAVGNFLLTRAAEDSVAGPIGWALCIASTAYQVGPWLWQTIQNPSGQYTQLDSMRYGNLNSSISSESSMQYIDQMTAMMEPH